MSTIRLTVYDLLRITYTYEGRAMEEAARSRSDSVCSSPEMCSHMSPPSPSGNFSILETDFTQRYCRKNSQ
ncbi:uncharacterized protein EKO05_0006405 [Ascochyta rabiei]|uniref:Uncharacterized protein n=1 Tax=Didymella rabiei TaxID=5454 RepID=A0A162WRP8_DIDRA|nr:uncharacterized protein EKO05_0006405 [Ascochyta rabiei]KZM19179.1 hypothetical protein ST47_g9672 [Ascochyta rabiei]UPX15976.1 hypothetical protein EKO05_0006405 [Ascochyta rabiei]